MEIHPILTGNLKLDGGAMFGVVPKVLWNKYYPADENNLCNWAMRCMLVVDGDRKILIDNGIGDKQGDRFFSHYYLNGDDTLEKSLAKHGLTPSDITDMFITHLHFDHCGGSIEKADKEGEFRTVFPNATYWVSKEQWDWATDPNHREKASFLKENIFPMKESGQMKFVEEGELFPGFEVRFFNGHTNGQAIPFIDYKGRKIVFMADLLPSHVHVPLPWVMAYDTRPLVTLEEKEVFMSEAADNEYILFLEHDLNIEACTVQHTPKGVKVKETFKLNEYLENL